MKIEEEDKEFAIRLRENLLDILDLWTSKDKQIEYQNNVPIADVSAELFCQWDDIYHPETIPFRLAFDEREREILSDFDKLVNHVSDKTPTYLPYITDFIKTNDWLIVNQAAIDTIKRIESTATNIT